MRRLKILHIEGSEEDAFLFVRACEAAGLQGDVRDVRNGTEAVSYLKGDGSFADRNAHPLPDLIVLDLKMPAMNGFDFLKVAAGGRGIPAAAGAGIHQIHERGRQGAGDKRRRNGILRQTS